MLNCYCFVCLASKIEQNNCHRALCTRAFCVCIWACCWVERDINDAKWNCNRRKRDWPSENKRWHEKRQTNTYCYKRAYKQILRDCKCCFVAQWKLTPNFSPMLTLAGLLLPCHSFNFTSLCLPSIVIYVHVSHRFVIRQLFNSDREKWISSTAQCLLMRTPLNSQWKKQEQRKNHIWI